MSMSTKNAQEYRLSEVPGWVREKVLRAQPWEARLTGTIRGAVVTGQTEVRIKLWSTTGHSITPALLAR